MRSTPIPFLERFVGVPIKPAAPAPVDTTADTSVVPVRTEADRSRTFVPEMWSSRLVEQFRASSMVRNLMDAGVLYAPEETPWFPVEHPTSPIIRLLYAELATYPPGSVAHSIGRVETFRDNMTFSEVIRGMSFSRVPNQDIKYFFIMCDDVEFRSSNLDFIKHTARDVVHQLAAAWAETDIPYWDTPIRR